MAKDNLTDVQRKIYDFIVDEEKRIGRTPSIREIQKKMEYAGISSVMPHLNALENRKMIYRIPNEDYGIRIVRRGIPLKGLIAAGKPLEIFSEPYQTIDLGLKLDNKEHYILQVTGNSMIEDHICDGDYLVIKHQNTLPSNKIIVAVHWPEPSSATLKRFVQQKHRICLEPANRSMEAIYISNKEWEQEWQIQGIVITILRPVEGTLLTKNF